MILLLFKAPFYQSRDTLILPISLFLLTVGLFIFLVYREKIFSTLLEKIGRRKNTYSPLKESLGNLFSFHITRITILGFIIFVTLLFILSVASVPLGVAIAVGPVAVLLFGFTFITVVFSILSFLTIPGRRPLMMYFLLYTVFISRCNDNTEIRTVDTSKPQRAGVEEDFDRWILSRKEDLAKDNLVKNSSDSTKKILPVIFIATEGGGIRALTWTALVLKNLEKRYPNIHHYIYGISGVSGGAVGGTFYVSYLRDSLKEQSTKKYHTFSEVNFNKTISSDFLSDILSAFLFQDNFQRVFPYPLKPFNRSRQIEDAWSKSYKDNLLVETFDKPFLNLWADTSLHIPYLFNNGVLMETGQKTIVSSLNIDKTNLTGENDVFNDEIDIISHINSDVPLKTAALLSARFPYITTGGLIKRANIKPTGHVIDGGYKENTGLETVFQLMIRLKDKMNDTLGYKIKPIVLFIKNGVEKDNNSSDKNLNFLQDATTPLYGLLNAWDRRSVTISSLTHNLRTQFLDKYKYDYITINLDRISNEGKQLPLGWFLSNKSFDFILNQAQSQIYKSADTPFNKELNKYFKPKL
ncbi:patatin-like phospholipase family protein [Emticicia aquatilis]|nr:patatin-like phospholipase family protein [Emticicia aquatilis]